MNHPSRHFGLGAATAQDILNQIPYSNQYAAASTTAQAAIGDGQRLYTTLSTTFSQGFSGASSLQQVTGVATMVARGLADLGAPQSVQDAANIVAAGFSGAAAGAAAGSCFFPGIGTIVGAAVGALLSIVQSLAGLRGGGATDPRPDYVKAVQGAPIPRKPCPGGSNAADPNNPAQLEQCAAYITTHPDADPAHDPGLLPAARALVDLVYDVESADPTIRATFVTGVDVTGDVASDGAPCIQYLGKDWSGAMQRLLRWMPLGLYYGSSLTNSLVTWTAGGTVNSLPDWHSSGVLASSGQPNVNYVEFLHGSQTSSPWSFDPITSLAAIALQHEQQNLSQSESDEIVYQWFLSLQWLWNTYSDAPPQGDSYLNYMIGRLKGFVNVNATRVPKPIYTPPSGGGTWTPVVPPSPTTSVGSTVGHAAATVTGIGMFGLLMHALIYGTTLTQSAKYVYGGVKNWTKRHV